MCEFSNKKFDQLITVISEGLLYKKMVIWGQKNYFIKQLALQTLTPQQVVFLVKRNFEKASTPKKNTSQLSNGEFQKIWVLNEFKLFVWVSLAYVYSNNKILQNLNHEDYVFLQEIFPRKSIDFMEYHIISIMKESKQIREKWTEDEELLLNEVIEQLSFSSKDHGQNIKWSEVSFMLFINSNKNLFKSPQKCRQKWTNHLNPSVNRNKWSLEEDQKLFRQVSIHGLKWALISKNFDGSRTQHMIKNRFNSLVKKYQSKSNRGTLKKIIQKIHIDLFKTCITDECKQISPNIQEQQSGSIEQISRIHTQSSQQKQTQTERPIEKMDTQLQMNSNKIEFGKFDIDSLLFSDTSIEIQIPKNHHQNEVQLIQFQYTNTFVIHDFVAEFFT